MGATESRRSSNEDVLLTIAEAAAIMRVSKMIVYRLVHKGDLPAIREGRSLKVPEQAVYDYIREHGASLAAG
ncbi:helix-turn-helix domain-containing protein [Nocardia brasiliensis]|uniref:helix-turn-helix domain-containing protein n=1 Tax=Nocardia brasiliensis TaxID=37326 RepID=UPI00366FB14F